MCMVRTLRCNIYVIFVHSEVHRNALFVLLNSHKDRILRQILMEVHVLCQVQQFLK